MLPVDSGCVTQAEVPITKLSVLPRAFELSMPERQSARAGVLGRTARAGCRHKTWSQFVTPLQPRLSPAQATVKVWPELFSAFG